MMVDRSIFDIRFDSSGELLPSQEELDTFLRSPKRVGRKERHGHDTAAYGELLQRVRAYEQRTGTEPDLQEKMFCFVLRHSCFVNLALKSSVEHYKYHLHTLAKLDFRKPATFIKTAEAEMKRLSQKKQESAKVARLWAMVEDRKKTLRILTNKRDALIGELTHIALYIRDNLAKIEKVCETAIVVLVNVMIGGSEEGRATEGIREYFMQNLGDYEGNGPVPRGDLDTVKDDIEGLSKEISRLFREDVYALAGLYEAIHGHAQRTVREIDAILAQTKREQDKGGEPYARLEGVLVSLVSDYRFPLKAAEVPADLNHQNLLQKKRKEMLDRLFQLLLKEGRQRVDRRQRADRRIFRDPHFKGTERRKSKERRSAKNRRRT